MQRFRNRTYFLAMPKKIMKKIVTFLLILLLAFTPSALAEITFGENIHVDDGAPPSWQWMSSIAADASGKIYLAWIDDRDGNDIYFSKSTDGGATFTSNIRIDDSGLPSSSAQLNPAIAVTPDGNNIYVVWQDYRNGTWDIYFAKSTDGGASFSKPNQQVNDVAIEHQAIPAIAVDINGYIYVIWQDERNGFGNHDIYFAKSTDSGASFSSNVRVDDTGAAVSDQMNPSIAVDDDGKIYIVWYDERNGDWDIYFAKSEDGGANFVESINPVNDPSAETQSFPSMAVTPNGDNIYIVWKDERNGDADIYFAKSTNGGVSFDSNISVTNDSTNSYQGYPEVATDLQGNIYVTWEDERNGNKDIYFAKSEDNGINFTDNILVSNNDSANSFEAYPAIAVDGQGKIYITWSDGRNGDIDIYFAKGREEIKSDLNDDHRIDFLDLAIMGNQWGQAPGEPSADIAPEGGDGIVNLLDLAILTSEWLACKLEPPEL